jgi:hypothetical protein
MLTTVEHSGKLAVREYRRSRFKSVAVLKRERAPSAASPRVNFDRFQKEKAWSIAQAFSLFKTQTRAEY